VDGESQHVHGGEQHGEVLFVVAEIMFEMIAVIFEGAESRLKCNITFRSIVA
jgi:hypothetical protein